MTQKVGGLLGLRSAFRNLTGILDQTTPANDGNQMLDDIAPAWSISRPPGQHAAEVRESDQDIEALRTHPSRSSADPTGPVGASGSMPRVQVEPGDTSDTPIIITDDDPRLGDGRTSAGVDTSPSDTFSGKAAGLSGSRELSEGSSCQVKEELSPDDDAVPPTRAPKRKRAHLSSQEDSQYDCIEFINMTNATAGNISQRTSNKRPKLVRSKSLPPTGSYCAPVNRRQRDQRSQIYEESVQIGSSASPDVQPLGFSRAYSYKRLTGYMVIDGVPHVEVAWHRYKATLYFAKCWATGKAIETAGKAGKAGKAAEAARQATKV
uniref:Uncharacterized protein n=1 Tax=Coccidioides posadasii RMSCC 3488 TaxID=454284 RepID=A0A0J6FF37_COCPO|nr:hypothetical protein CPAG_05256 [Coccidioides posadasii RMSCC 3488]